MNDTHSDFDEQAFEHPTIKRDMPEDEPQVETVTTEQLITESELKMESFTDSIGAVQKATTESVVENVSVVEDELTFADMLNSAITHFSKPVEFTERSKRIETDPPMKGSGKKLRRQNKELQEHNSQLMGDYDELRREFDALELEKLELESQAEESHHQIQDLQMRLQLTNELYQKEKIEKENTTAALQSIVARFNTETSFYLNPTLSGQSAPMMNRRRSDCESTMSSSQTQILQLEEELQAKE